MFVLQVVPLDFPPLPTINPTTNCFAGHKMVEAPTALHKKANPGCLRNGNRPTLRTYVTVCTYVRRI